MHFYSLFACLCLLFLSGTKGDPDVYKSLESFVFDVLENLPNLEQYIEHQDWNDIPEEDSLKDYDYEEREAGPSSFRPTVTVPELGTARGRIMKSMDRKEFYAFHSIPFAKPPVGNMRFKMPEPFEGPWPQDLGDRGEYDATYLRAQCPQASFVSGAFGIFSMPSGREDCLHVSVYTPANFTSTSNFPVMFFIHGGAFYEGGASLYVPTKIMDRDDIITVVVQYRLGTLGFLNAGTPDAPGNMGLMDQIEALRWVQKYIQYFGGDPDQVTVIGQSAGAASASWMQMTPQTRADAPGNNDKQLLERIIPMSGSALELWTLDTEPAASFILEAKATGCYVENDTAASLQCMKDADLGTVVQGFLSVIFTDMHHGGLGFKGTSPTIQNQPGLLDYPELIVIDKHPIKTIKDGDALNVDVLCGSVRDEGSLIMSLTYETFIDYHNLTYDEFFLSVEFVPFFIHAFGIEDLTGAVANTMSLDYLKYADTKNLTSMMGGLIDMGGMLFLKTGLYSMAHLLHKYNTDNKIFFYSFEFESDDTIYGWEQIAEKDFNSPVFGGITHADDLMYLFYLPSQFDEREKTQARRESLLMTNFAKYGDPTPEVVNDPKDEWRTETEKWKPFNTDTLDFLLIQDELTMQQDFKLRWNYNTIKDPNCSA